jgi:acetolactate synthase-1/2/3 large subunit
VGQRGANFTQQNADWLLTIGARLDLGQTAYSHKNFARGARKIIVDVDANEIRKLQMSPDVPVCADAGEFVREMLSQQRAVVAKDRGAWLHRAKAWQAKYPTVVPEYWDAKDAVNTYVLVDVLAEEMSGADLLVPGSSGACSEITMQAFRVKSGMRVFNTQGLGSMGFGVPAAIGGCLASGGRRTVCVEGDGGFVMNTQELEVVRRLNLPIKIFVLNNDGYNSIRSTQRSYFQGRLVGCDSSSGVTLPDIRKVAGSFGVTSMRIENHTDIRQQVRRVLAVPGPVVCEVLISPSQFTAPRTMSMQKPDGAMVTQPMEDMYPYLPREEFRANMIVPPSEMG